jgi:hypothetical protein
MDLLGIRTDVRGELDDAVGATESQQLWKDSELNGYTNEAVDVFCREIPLIIDSSTAADDDSIALCQITTEDGTQDYALSPKVVAIRRAKVSGELRPLVEAEMDLLDKNDSYWDDVSEKYRQTPLYYLLGRETDKLTLIRCPDDIYTVNLTVQRLPLVDLAADGDVPEISSAYHRLLFSYIKYKAYMKRDVETFSERKAGAEYKQHLIDLEKARVDVMRKITSRRVVGIGAAFR